MNCVCYNLFNELQRQINNLLTTAAHNRLTSGSSTTDDGAYRPNLNLLEPSVNNTFDLNTLFYASNLFDNIQKDKNNEKKEELLEKIIITIKIKNIKKIIKKIIMILFLMIMLKMEIQN